MAKYDYFVIDIGSTYTKQRLFKDCRLVATSQAPTTMDNVYKGITLGREKIQTTICDKNVNAEHVIATSSAAGGLRMVAMGYMVRVTAKLPKSGYMNLDTGVEIISQEDQVQVQILKEINRHNLAGWGTDGGDESSILKMLN